MYFYSKSTSREHFFSYCNFIFYLRFLELVSILKNDNQKLLKTSKILYSFLACNISQVEANIVFFVFIYFMHKYSLIFQT